ncbi:MAG: hypothetical protein H3C47_07470, partial [Candidatus Cloacimonetes bacterium]|nr:hypothetical protein [Candidatus Cloacimonadota bacterium]
MFFGFGCFALAQADDSVRQGLFHSLYAERSFPVPSLPVQPGVHNIAPLDLGINPLMPPGGSAYLMGSFGSSPGLGDKTILFEWPDRGNALVSIYKTQYFSGWRWFWYGEPGGAYGKIVGGYYDLSSQTLPSAPSMTKNWNHLRLSWVAPKASGYSTRVSLMISPRADLELLNAQAGKIIYDGSGTSTSLMLEQHPGNWVSLGFFGMREINGLRIDSGGGVQKFTSSSGAVNPIASVFGSRNGDGLESRALLRFAIPKLLNTSQTFYKFRPAGSSDPEDQYGNVMPWPKSEDRYIVLGSHFMAQNLQDWKNRV